MTSTRSAAPLPAKPQARPSWIPIRSLAARHRECIAAHLLSLDTNDRYLRFGYPATDEQISNYVRGLDFDRDEIFGIFNRRVELIALAHLAHGTPRSGAAPARSEFGVSVLNKSRGRGFGRRLFEHAMLHARNRGVETLFIHALSENAAMLKIARRAGAVVERDGFESEAHLTLPPDTLASHVDEMVGQRAAEIDYHLKHHARQVGGLLDALTEATQSITGTTRTDD